jgi:hypothetical protein
VSQPVPHQMRNTQDLIHHLSTRKTELAAWFDNRKDSLSQIVTDSVGGNTFRAFRNLPCKPSVVFREWALATLEDRSSVSELEGIRSQAHYDDWTKRFCGRLYQTWQERMGKRMEYGPGRKLPNLLLKEFMLWSGLNDDRRHDLIGFLHVPLDRYTLVGIRNCVTDPKITMTATMKSVSGETMYDQLQSAIRQIASTAGVPSIYFDVLAWNMSH